MNEEEKAHGEGGTKSKKRAMKIIPPEEYTLMMDAVISMAIEGIGVPLLKTILTPFIGEFEVVSYQTHRTMENGRDRLSCICDAIICLKDGRKVNLEIQRGKKFTPKRALYYLSNMVSRTLAKREPYTKIPPCMMVIFCENDPFGRGEPTYTYHYREDRKPHATMGDDSCIMFINCASKKFNKKQKKIVFDMVCKNDNLMHSKTMREGLLYARGKPKEVSQMAVKHMYDYIGYFTEEGRAEGREQGLAEGREQGLAKGRQEERVLWISSLLAQGKLSRKDIADAGGIPLSEVEALASKKPTGKQ